MVNFSPVTYNCFNLRSSAFQSEWGLTDEMVAEFKEVFMLFDKVSLVIKSDTRFTIHTVFFTT